MADSSEATKRLEALEAQLADLLARRRSRSSSKIVQNPRTIVRAPYWLMDVLENEPGISVGTDADTLFNDVNQARITFGRPTARGELEYHLDDDNDRSTRCRLMFYAKEAFSTRALVAYDGGSSRLQLKINNQSPFTALADEGVHTLEFRRGVNLLQLSLIGGASKLQFLANILGCDNKWLDPCEPYPAGAKSLNSSYEEPGLISTE
jgi:hypothetical protein